MPRPLRFTEIKPQQILIGNCLDLLRCMPTNSVDLIFTSPPYEDARTYGMDFTLRGQEWVNWALERYIECCRVCRGLVAWVVAGRTKNYEWSGTPALLMADLIRAGVRLRNPPLYKRVGIPGSGGPDWLRNDYEFIICAAGGRLPWSQNTVMGQPPKYPPGGKPSHRLQNGQRVKEARYQPPEKANPGNVIECHGGGGHLGHKLAHENEAPFSEKLVEFFVRSFCPPEGIVLDPFCGSGTTLAVAQRHGRQWLGFEIRESQVELSYRRVFPDGKPRRNTTG